jgi:hypothetical protein
VRRGLGLLAVLGVALALRWTALAVPHFESDEPAFEGLAQSLVMGNGYTTRRVGLEVIETSPPLCLATATRRGGSVSR